MTDTLTGVSFHPGRAERDAASGVGAVDYRLQRRRTLADFRSGKVAPSEVCDAHPELLRVARNCTTPSNRACPVCGERGGLSSVHYVFGPRLPASGKLALDEHELERFARRSGDFAAYEVEVCTKCGWNHLLRRRPLES